MPFGTPRSWSKSRIEGLRKPPRAAEETDNKASPPVSEQSELERAMRGIADLEHVEPQGRDYSGVVEDPETPESADKLLEALRRGDGERSSEETPREIRARLKAAIEKFGSKKQVDPKSELELKDTQAFTDIELTSTEAYRRREERAAQFAEKYNITDVRNQLLSAEREYTDAIRDLKVKRIKLPFKHISDDVQERYDEAVLAWRASIARAVDLAPQKEKYQATVISFRDTVMRAEEARQRAVLEASTIKDQELFGKIVSSGKTGLRTVAAAYLGGTKKIAERIADTHVKVREHLKGEGRSKEELVDRYTRATRIVSSAVLGTFLFGGVGTAGVATSVLLRAVRGTLGVTVGSAVGVLAGKGYRKTAGTMLREDLRDVKRNQVLDEKGLDHERLLWRLGRGSALERQTRTAEILGALIGGASTSMAIHEISSLQSVQNAHETLDQGSHTVESTKAPTLPQSHPVHTQGTIGPQEVPVKGALQIDHGPLIVGRGEGADKLISDLQERLRAEYPNVKTAPENVRALLRFDAHTTAEHLGLGHESGGVMLHPGDSLSVDDHGRLVFHDNIHDRNRIIINEKHELHPLKGPVVKPHGGKAHKAQATHEKATVRTHRSSFDSDADRRAVAEANKEELAREQQGTFQTPILTETPQTIHIAEPAPVETVPHTGSARLGDLATSETVPVAAPPPEVLHVDDTPVQSAPEIQPVPVSQPSVEAPTTDPTNTTSSARLGDLAREQVPMASEQLNPFGLNIDARVPHVYLTEAKGVTVYGGSPEAGRLIATEYAKSHPGVDVTFEVKGVDGLGNQVTYAGDVSTDASGKVFVNIPDPKTEAVLPPPDPNTFIDVKP